MQQDIAQEVIGVFVENDSGARADEHFTEVAFDFGGAGKGYESG